jgi:RNA polymerase sigma factor (sigma-70 family)
MSDAALLAEFTDAEAQSAFTALVRRHVDMVYATALRQLGDTGLAEEVTQNVFIALARKSEGLCAWSTISGWLYKTTLLEARHALRSELRRRRREAVAVELNSVASSGDSAWASLVPLLDEALMRLREDDRLAVLLRFFEEKPFRDVGLALGISEDAAQKRVSKSLDELTRFFQRSGFRVNCAGASGAALFAQAATAAPAHLAANVTQAALAAAGGAGLSGLGLIAFKIMNVSQVQLAVACVVLAAVPIAYEAHAVRAARQDTAALAAQLAARRQSFTESDEQRARLTQRLRALEESLAVGAAWGQARTTSALLPAPRWVDGSPFARVPKELLQQVRVSALGRDWRIRPELAATLGMTPEQFEGAQRAVDDFYAEIRALEEAHLVRQTPAPEPAEDGERMVFRITRYEPEANEARLRLRERLMAELDATRADLALKYFDFAPARRVTHPGAPLPEDDFFEQGSLSSDRWNFHGYERTVTVLLPSEPTRPPTITVDVKTGGNGMSFGGDRHMFNPATAPSVRAQWDAFERARPSVAR